MSHTLFEINEFLRRVIALNLPEALWVRAELVDVSTSKGHVYLELVQKLENEPAPIAKAQAVIWNKTFRQVQGKFGVELEAILQPGMEILFLAKVEFHERYGLKFVVEDIDPSHTIGKLELQRRETIRKLQSLDLLAKNGSISLPPVIQRIAVLSAETAAGLQDFLEHLSVNIFGYTFQVCLFPVAVQGNLVEREFIDQLEKLAKQNDGFHTVAIIRGGGARLDLAAFDSFQLAKAVANFPIPVIIGIGHEVDETVLDLVAHTSLKTPTAVADFVLQHNLQFETHILKIAETIKHYSAQQMNQGKFTLNQLGYFLELQAKSKLQRHGQMLGFIEKEIPTGAKHQLIQVSQKLSNLEKMMALLHPETALRRGFAIVQNAGKHLVNAGEVEVDDEIAIKLGNGSLTATVKTRTI